jgi:diadenylate cyclase
MIWWGAIVWPGWRGLIEISLIAGVVYFVLVMFRGTRSMQVLTGLIVVVIGLLALTKFIHLTALNWMLRQFFLYAAVGALILFQPEIRRALAEIGRKPVFRSVSETRRMVDAVVEAAAQLSAQRIGALIAIERDIGTRAIQETGIPLDSHVNAELLVGIFFPHTPLHDGGVIITGNRIAAAGCLFPLSQQTEISRGLGTRHRAALGLAEETDAVTVVVSEESGTISVGYRGALSRDYTADRLRNFLMNIFVQPAELESPWRRLWKQMAATMRGGKSPPRAGKDRRHDR